MAENPAEIDAIRRTVQKYIDGIAHSDVGLVAEAFHPDASMSGHFSNGFRVSPASSVVAYMKKLPPTSEHSPKFRGRILHVRCDGTLATATIAEDQLQGKDFITHFHLHKVDSHWLITAKATYAADPTPARPG
jgi:hypothetical protein